MPPYTASLSLVGPSGPIAPGAAFDVQVILNSPVGSRGAQFGLTFDRSLVTVTGVDEGTYYSAWAQANQASTGLVPGDKMPAQNGWMTPVGIFIIGGTQNTGPNGSGLLATVHLRAQPNVTGRTTLAFQGVIVSVMCQNSAVSLPGVQVTDTTLVIGSNTTARTHVPTPLPRLVSRNAMGSSTTPVATCPTVQPVNTPTTLPAPTPFPTYPPTPIGATFTARPTTPVPVGYVPGAPAIRPTRPATDPATPAFTPQDVADYVNAYGAPYSLPGTPLTIESVQFLSNRDIEARFHTTIAHPDDALMCLVTFRGSFLAPAPGGVPHTQFPVEYRVFDAHTGNELLLTFGKS
jgi:hypothetical protein